MKRSFWTFAILCVMSATSVIAQPPGGPGGGPGGPGGGAGGPGGPGGPGGGGQRGRSLLVEALDADHDGVISAEEIKNATAALITLDKNKDGKLTEDEFRQAGMGGGGPGGPGAAARGGAGGEGRGPGGAGGPGGGEGRGPGGEGRGPGGPPNAGGPGGEGRGPGGPNGGMAINPDRMLNHAMEFDADKDGKLSKDELQKFIASFIERQANAGGREGGREGGRGGREGGGAGERPRRPE